MNRHRISPNKTKPLKFQVLEFVCDDTKITEDSDDTTDEARFQKNVATIYAFGVTEE